MTLTDLLEAPPASLADLWMVMAPEVADELTAAQASEPQHRLVPTALTDGRFASCCDALGEPLFDRANKVLRAHTDAIEVIHSAALRELLPQTEKE